MLCRRSITNLTAGAMWRTAGEKMCALGTSGIESLTSGPANGPANGIGVRLPVASNPYRRDFAHQILELPGVTSIV
jgi:hypothetical protein